MTQAIQPHSCPACKEHTAAVALSLTFQIWWEWATGDDPLDDKTRPEVSLAFTSWVRRLLPDILTECMPKSPAHVDAHVDSPNTKLGAYAHPSLPGDYVEDGPDGLSTLRRESGQPVMVIATAALDAMGQCPWCDACYSTRDELLKHLDAVGRHEGARLVLAEACVATIEAEAERVLRVCEETRADLLKTRQRVAELQAVVDAYGEHGHSVVVKAGEDGEVDVWSDGHAHAFAPLSTVRALRERVAQLEDVAESTRCELTAPDGHGAQHVAAWDSLVALRKVLSKRCTCGLDDFDSDHTHDAQCPLSTRTRTP